MGAEWNMEDFPCLLITAAHEVVQRLLVLGLILSDCMLSWTASTGSQHAACSHAAG